MIGSGLKKLAKENGMTIAKGIAFGSLRGYAACLFEGAGWKQIVFTTVITDAEKKLRFMDAIGAVDMTKQFRVQKLSVTSKAIQVTFHDNPGTMKKIGAFLDWFIPMLGEAGAAGANVCTECGSEVTGGRWVLINRIAYYLHDSCAQKVKQKIEDDKEQQKAEDDGSYLTGALGAFGGAAIGAVAWALVLYMGYVASLLGLVIGWLAEKGYNLLKGKQNRVKVVILILAIIFGVVAGTFAADVLMLVNMINSGELMGFTMGDIPQLMSILLNDAEYTAVVGKNIFLGLIFAALGVFALLRQTGKKVSGVSYTELN